MNQNTGQLKMAQTNPVQQGFAINAGADRALDHAFFDYFDIEVASEGSVVDAAHELRYDVFCQEKGWESAFEGSFDATTNTAVWTAANGDTVTNQTTSFVLADQVSPNVFRYLQELTITGGSGRFADTSGHATVTGLYNLNTGSYDGQLEGCISQLTVGN